MRAVSGAFLRTVTGSHRAAFRATVCETYQTTTTPIGERVKILAGAVTLDGTADVYASLDITIGGSQFPRHGADVTLAPYGNEIYVERGIALSDFNVEYVGLGYFRIDEPEQEDAVRYGPIQLEARDRMAGIVDARLLAPRQFAAGVSLAFVVLDLVLEVYPDAVVEWDDGTEFIITTRPLICEEDRFGFLDDLVRSHGKIWNWDHRGALVIRTMPDATPVLDVMSGADGTLTGLSRRLSRAQTYNAVVAKGEAADVNAPVRGVRVDLNPDSPTYWDGRFGKKPRYFSSPFITTTAQAEAAAEAMLRRSIGLSYSVDLTTAPNPALEPHDAIRVRASSREGAEIHVLETLSIPLVADAAMTATTREQTIVLIGGA